MGARWGERAALLQADNTDDDSDGVESGVWEFERFVFLIVGDDEDVILVAARFDALDERALFGVEDVDLVPLEEEVGHGYALAGNDVARTIFGIHA